MAIILKNIVWWISFWLLPHPFYVSVTELKYNASKKNIEISCKMFTNDLEDALKKTNGKSIDVLNPTNKAEVEKVIFDYISKRLSITINGKTRTFKYIGYEKEEEAIWVYLEITACENPIVFAVDNKLLFDYLKEQINIVHCEVGTFKESRKLTNPDSGISFLVK